MNVEKLKNLYSQCSDKYAAASEMGTTYQTLYNIIYKGSVCKVDLLKRIANYFNVSVGYFFDEIDDSSLIHETGKSSIEGMISLLQKKDEQMDRLITLLEHKYGVSEKEKRNVG